MNRGLATALAVGGGVMLSGQARINGQLTEHLGSAFVVTLLSFLTGAAILTPIVVASARSIGLTKMMGQRWHRWWLLTGPLGAFLIVTISAGVPIMGVALVTVLTVAGQTVAGVVLDAKGSVSGRVALSRRRLGSVIVAVAGLGITAYAVSAETNDISVVWLGILLVVAGVASSLQQAANGAITGASGSPFYAGMLTFVGGSAALLVAVTVLAAAGGLTDLAWPLAKQWWLYTGGLLGTAFVVLTAWIVRRIGVLALALAVVAGQLLGGLVLDATTGGPPINFGTIASVVTVLVAVLLALERPRGTSERSAAGNEREMDKTVLSS